MDDVVVVGSGGRRTGKEKNDGVCCKVDLMGSAQKHTCGQALILFNVNSFHIILLKYVSRVISIYHTDETIS